MFTFPLVFRDKKGSPLSPEEGDLNVRTLAKASVGLATVALSAFGIQSDADLSLNSTNFGTDQSSAIQAVLDLATLGPLKVIWDVKVGTSTGFRLRANTEINPLPGCGAILFSGVDKSLLENYNLRGQRTSTSIDKNIKVTGGIWNGNGSLADGTPNRAKGSPTNGANCVMRFYGVDNLLVENCDILNPRTYAFHGVKCKWGTVDRMRVDVGSPGANKDGIHFDSNCFDCAIKNCKTKTYDDGTGGNFGDYYTSQYYFDGVCGQYYAGFSGPGARIDFLNHTFYEGTCGHRLLSGTERVDDIKIIGSRGQTANYGLVIDNFRQDPSRLENPGPGNFGYILVEDYGITSDSSIDFGLDKLACININANVERLVFRSMKRRTVGYNYPQFRLTGTGYIGELVLEGYDCSEACAVDHILVEGPTINHLDGSQVRLTNTAAAGGCFVKVTSGTINILDLTGATIIGLDNVASVTGSGKINYIGARGIRHIGASAGAASFNNTSANPVLDIMLSNYFGAKQVNDPAKFLSMRGDGFGSTQTGGTPLPGSEPSGLIITSENFDSGKTNFDTFGADSVVVANGQLVTTLAGGAGYSGVSTKGKWSLQGRRAQVEVVKALTNDSNFKNTMFGLRSQYQPVFQSENTVKHLIESGRLLAQDRLTSVKDIAWDPVAMRHLSMRVDGDSLLWEFGANGTTWQAPYAVKKLSDLLADGIALSDIAMFLVTGTWSQVNGINDSSVFDNLKITVV
jgi:hypothetical protein